MQSPIWKEIKPFIYILQVSNMLSTAVFTVPIASLRKLKKKIVYS